MIGTLKWLAQWLLLIFLCSLFPILWIPVIAELIVWLALTAVKIIRYRRGAYWKATKLPYIKLGYDLGKYGEYLTYEKLRRFEKNGARFLFNIYIPKDDGGTTEIDVLMLTAKGIFVFESKNYSGWIFGSENQKNWVQSLPRGRGRKSQKDSFYNPVWQNRSHIKHLQALIGDDVDMYSVIVFSERCTLKKINIYSRDLNIVKRDKVVETVKNIWKSVPADVMSESDIAKLYDMLYPYSQVSKEVKQQHIIDISEAMAKDNDGEDEIGAADDNTDISKVIAVAASSASDTPATADMKAADVVTETETCASAAEEQLRCPRCGGKLVLRTAAKGGHRGNRFYGCSNFPRCRYIKNAYESDCGENKS